MCEYHLFLYKVALSRTLMVSFSVSLIVWEKVGFELEVYVLMYTHRKKHHTIKCVAASNGTI